MARSRQVFSRASFARSGMSIALAATLAVGSVPAIALVQANVTGDAPVALAAESGTYDLEVNKEYPVDMTWSNNMGSQFLGDQAIVVFDGNSYSVKLALTEAGLAFADSAVLTFNGVEYAPTNGVFSFPFTTLESGFQLTITKMGGMPVQPTVDVSLDLNSLPTGSTDGGSGEGSGAEQPDPEPGDGLVAGTTYAVPLDMGGSMAGSMLGSSAFVTPHENGTYTVVITVKASDSYCFSGLTVGGVEASKAYSADGESYVFTAEGVSTIDGAVTLGFTYTPYVMWRTMNHSADATLDASSATAGAELPAVQEGAVKFDLNNVIAQAKTIAQGGKSDEAWGALQDAIATAEQAAASPTIPQVGVDGSTDALIEAIIDFNASDDVSDPGDDAEDPDVDVDADDYGMVAGKTYAADVSYTGTGAFASADMSAIVQQMIGRYFGNSVALERLEDGTYDVIFSFAEYNDAVGDMTYDGEAIQQSADRTYAVNVPSLSSPIELGIHIGGAMNMDVTYAATIDTSTIEEASETSDGEQDGITNPGENNNQNTTSGSNEQTVRFQVGHTYQVPIAILKQNSTETSMAAQYFGSTAYVRPLDNGTMEVSFSTNRTDYISGITYQGAAVSQSGATFTLTIPYTESDTVLPLGLTIVPMQQLGMGTVTADLHLYLTQATDLGAGEVGSPSSVSSLPKTGDGAGVVGVVGVAALATAGLAAAGAAGMSRRRDQR